MFTDEDPARRQQLSGIFRDIIDLAGDYGKKVNIGRVRGNIEENKPEKSFGLFAEMVSDLCTHAARRDVTLVLEPVNRYELNFINALGDGVEVLEKLRIPNLKLMPDVFHMNIEDPVIHTELVNHIEHIAYIHLADSNRLAPGKGHTDFEQIFNGLKEVSYEGWCSVEILPEPEPVLAAKQAAEFLIPLVRRYNQAE
jgi:sugar phosphate isomerase/epimerase